MSFFPVDSLSQDRTVVEKNTVKMLDKEAFFDYASFWGQGVANTPITALFTYRAPSHGRDDYILQIFC